MKKHFEKNTQGTVASDLQKFSSFRGGRFNDGPREMHKAKCADCGNECEVPFKPKEGRPVFCRACYPKHRPQR